MIVRTCWLYATVLVFLLNKLSVQGDQLTPPYFNLAEGRKIHATATCGEDTEGPELYCKLVGATSENDINVNVIQGQLCDVCDPKNETKKHPPEYAVDGMETWWQSPPLSRGMKYNEVNLTIDFGQEFHVAYVFIRMGNSPRPRLWVLEKSDDYGKTYKPWQYFSDSPDDCETYFGKESLQPITRDDSVICTTEYSKIVPLEGGEIPISILNNRPSANYYFNSTVLQEWTRATNVRLRLMKTKNFLGHLMSVMRQDPTVTRRYFYSIKDISIGGRCMCNGHAESCDIQDPNDPATGVVLCRCQHNTCGAKCDSCCPGYQQKKWQQSKVNHPFSCEPCNCFLHSNTCVYNETIDESRQSLDIYGKWEGGGVCKDCQHNTEGINCNKCKAGYFRPYNKHWNETDVCQPCKCDHKFSTGNCAEGSGQCECKKEFTPPLCNSCSFGYYGYPDCRPCTCFLNGTEDLQCEARNGKCPCLYNFGGQYCKECVNGFYNFPNCDQCKCNYEGSVSTTCEQTSGNCTCKNNFSGKNCEQCQDGYFNYPKCNYCNCDVKGTKNGICEKSSGKCICKEGYGGENCDQCLPGFYGYPECKPCNCSLPGSLGTTCSATGKCACTVSYAGKTCEQCSPGYYKYPDCLPCECDSQGSNGVSCDTEGTCECHYNFAGQRCNKCKESFYNFPACEDCNCHPAGVVSGFAGCGSVPAGELCQCKERVEGRICDKCRPLFWNLHANNPQGCEQCQCHIPGTLGGLTICDSENGQCTCKSLVVARGCTECADGTYDLQENNLFGCSDCDCDVGGSINTICDKNSGQCYCQNRVTGRRCDEPLQTHYFPTLYQYRYELEDGHTPANTVARYANEESAFSNYSWRGYAVFSNLQKKILHDIYVDKPALYRMVLRFVNKNQETITGTVTVTPENPNDNEQQFQVQFRNSSKPAFVTVGDGSTAFVMSPGRWQVGIEVNKPLLVDYYVLLPEEYYSATILNKKVDKPCTLNESSLCRHYTYLNVTQYPITFGVGGYVDSTGGALREFFQSTDHLSKIGIGNRVPIVNPVQTDVSFNITVQRAGSYVLIVNYVIPLDDKRKHKLGATITSGPYKTEGNIIIYACPYTTMCRQAVTTKDGRVAIQQVDGNEIKLDLHGDNANVGIHSIVAIPYEEWSLDYIKPKSVCIKMNGKCIASRFRTPPESKKIHFEDANRSESHVLNNSTYILLHDHSNTLDLKGKVPSSGYYTFIVHYYQPNFQDFVVTVLLQNGQIYEATVPVQYCPSQSGCRSVIRQTDNNRKFSLTENFMMTLKGDQNRHVYIDYLIVIPHDLYDDRYLEEENVDRTSEFISTCGNNHFNIDTTIGGFCRDAVYSITAGYNSGALPCQCDYDGSLSFECDKFGGQCPCRQNIIGRKCEACKTGYYGFPNCKPCNCPSTAYCEPSTGQCICPEHVVGERCDQCEQLTYGYDPIIGCEQCKCNLLGSISLQCDLFNGTCDCKPNIVGRQCDVCLAGHFYFPYCRDCNCDVRGTTNEICDQNTAACLCKKNTVGPLCERCVDGTFNLQDINEDGCSQCFCFGKTTRCTSSQLVVISTTHMDDWAVVTLNTSLKLEIAPSNLSVEKLDDVTVSINFTPKENQTKYFLAPADYLGKKLTIYGGFLNYTLFYMIGNRGSAVSGPDVILQGKKTYLTYSSNEQPPPDFAYISNVQFVESNFELPSGLPAKRDHIMEVLEDLRGIYIRATYWSVSINTQLSNVYQSEAIEYDYQQGEDTTNLNLALSVEQCHCPPNYMGLSCEECAPGYYRVDNGPHGGYCVACQCHGHASECDVNTGICINCTHNTRGDHCEMCEVGYHGNTAAGTPGDCLICACPLPVANNNFATSCEVTADGEKISCECEDGYAGARCHYCAAGYYGQPEVYNDFCKPCVCSNNINPSDPDSCDTVTGECLRCLNNTYGDACALCSPWHYGDAIDLKNCQSCLCDKIGTAKCNSFTGECVCKPNVIGEKCDRCALEHYGFQSGQGCRACNCGEASNSNQCDDVNGQCSCKPGVTGRTCDRCSAGYWNYTSDGCVSCGCKSEYSLGFGCNALTGQCECLSGVVGEKCDQCPHRWVFIPEVGCNQCESCTHALLDTTDELATLIDPIITEFDSANSGYFTRRKLDNMREQLSILKPKFAEVDPKKISLKGPLSDLDKLEQEVKGLHRKVNYSLENSDVLKNSSDELKDKAEELLNDADIFQDETLPIALEDIEKIAGQLNKEDGPEVELAVEEGREMLKSIKNYNLSGRKEAANKENKKVDDLLEIVNNVNKPVQDLSKNTTLLKDDLKSFNQKLDELHNQTQYSLNTADEAQKIIDKTGKDRLKKKLEEIKRQAADSKNNLDVSETLNKNASTNNFDAGTNVDKLRSRLDDIQVNNNEFIPNLDHDELKINKIKKLIPDVEEHAQNLSGRAAALDNLLTESRGLSENAVKAAKAYKDIVEAVKSANEAANQAKGDATQAFDLLNGVENKTFNAEQISSDKLNSAYELHNLPDKDLTRDLQKAQDLFNPVKETYTRNGQLLEDIVKILQNIQRKSSDSSYRVATEKADDAIGHVTNIETIANETFAALPTETENAQQLPKKVDDMSKNILQTQRQLDTINEKLPIIIQKINEIPNKQNDLDKTAKNIEQQLSQLNRQIALSRDIANQIKIGMRFYPNTTLELKNPPNIEDLSTSTRITGYFKTASPHGLLWYLGNPVGTNLRRTKTDDYMALVIQNGYPVLKLDLGNGAEQIINEKYVSDNNWYQFIIDRTGHNAKLSIREELPNKTEHITTQEKSLEGSYSIFNLDRNRSKLSIGSLPANTDIQKEVDANSFDGEIEDLVIGHTPISLWNFDNGYENNHGAIERDKLVNLVPSTGYRFNGNGYVLLDARSYLFRTRSEIEFKFKTFATEGLLFLAGKGKSFISIELRNGVLLYQYNLGSDTKLWHTSKKSYNDGKWHTVSASREGPLGRFIVDNEEIKDNSPQITGATLDSIDIIALGGYSSKHNFLEVTNTKFDGCIDNVVIMGSPHDLRKNIRTYDVTPGCPDKFVRTVSFDRKKPGYIGRDDFSVSNDFKIGLKFKTKESNGLIFYGTDQLHTANISLSLKKGRLVLISQNHKLESKDTFNDSEWHVVSVMHNDRELRIDFDDFGFQVTDSSPPPLHILNGILYIGGLPSYKHRLISTNTIASSLPFTGCIADLTLQGNIINFANSTRRLNELLGKCTLDDSTLPGIHPEPSLPPVNPLEEITEAPFEEATLLNELSGVTNARVDGGVDEVPIIGETLQPPDITTEGYVGRATLSTPKPKKNGCVLPLVPKMGSDEGNYRFGTQKESRLEFHHLRGKYRKQFDFSFEFKTDTINAVIFFISDNAEHKDYVNVGIIDGYVVYSYGSRHGGNVVIKSDRNFNDGKWHYVQFSREEGNGKLVIDSNFVYDAMSNITRTDIKAPLYIGGLRSDDVPLANLDTTAQFIGCIRNLNMNSKPLENPDQIGVIPCEQNVEPGTYFPVTASTGYVRLKEPKFRIGEVFNIKFEMKPRRESGVLIAASGRRDYFILEMVDGVMRLTVESGSGPIMTSYKPPKFYFCDGNWHSVQAVKSKNVVTLSVDNVFTEPSLGDRHEKITNTGSALFLGGHRFLNKAKGIQSKMTFVGCIRNVFIADERIDIVSSMAEPGVRVGYCPTN